MDKNFRLIMGGLLVALLSVTACQKSHTVLPITDGNISYFNVSEYLQNQLLALTNGRRSFLLIDTSLMNSAGIGRDTPDLPYFDFQNYFYQFPNGNYNALSPQQGWISYMRMAPGVQFVDLTDTGGHHSLITAGLRVSSSIPTTVYFSDSLGFFRYWQLADTVTMPSSGVAFRVLNLCPDAGPVTVTVAGSPVPGVSDSLVYGQVSPFVPYPVLTDTMVQVRVYAVTDLTTIIASLPLNASPGHAYNIVIKGYLNNQSFPDPYYAGWLNFSPDMGIVVRQVK